MTRLNDAAREAWLRTAAARLGIELTPRFIVSGGKTTGIKITDYGEREFGVTTIAISTRDSLYVSRFKDWWHLTPAGPYPLFTLTGRVDGKVGYIGEDAVLDGCRVDPLWAPLLLSYHWPRHWPGDVAWILRNLH